MSKNDVRKNNFKNGNGKSDEEAADRGLSLQINERHEKIVGCTRDVITLSIEVGGMLTKIKDKIGWGQWEDWVKKHLSFTSRTARNYMKLWNGRDKVKSEMTSENGLTLTQALRLLTEPDNGLRDIRRGETQKWRQDYADAEHPFENPDEFMDTIHHGSNTEVLPKMINAGLNEKITLVITSPPYNNDRYYGPEFDDYKEYNEYLNTLIEPFAHYARILRPGGRVIYNVPCVVGNKEKNKPDQPYYHLIVDDLCRRVEELHLGFRFFDRIIWCKPNRNPCDNNKFGTFADPHLPVIRPQFEYVCIWAYQQFELPNMNNTTPDITHEEYLSWSTNVWDIAPSIPKNPNPAAFPEKLVERIIKLYSRPGDWIVDPYSGSGTTCLVCKKYNRHYTGIDIQAGQCKWAKDRIGA
jgi:DNA modification methylase